MLVEKNVALRPFNTFHIAAKAHTLARIASETDVHELLAEPELGELPKFVLGGGSNSHWLYHFAEWHGCIEATDTAP